MALLKGTLLVLVTILSLIFFGQRASEATRILVDVSESKPKGPLPPPPGCSNDRQNNGGKCPPRSEENMNSSTISSLCTDKEKGRNDGECPQPPAKPKSLVLHAHP